MGKVQFVPPSEEDATTRKLYGGGKANAPTGKSGRGWHGDYEGHVAAAHLGWETRKNSDRVPDSNKEFATRYPKATEEPGWSDDAEKLKHLNKDEEKHIKEDEKIRQRGMKESMKVEQNKVELERQIRGYEDKHDDKLRKQIDKEEQVMKERKTSEEAYKRDVVDAEKVLEEYDTKERKLQSENERKIRDGKISVQKEDFKQAEAKEKLLLDNIQKSSINLNKLRQEKQTNDNHYRQEVKNYDDITNKSNKDLMEQAKSRLREGYQKNNTEITSKINDEQKLNKDLKGELESTRKHETFLKKELGSDARDFDISKLKSRPVKTEVRPEVKQEQKAGSFDISKLRERHPTKPVEKRGVEKPIGTPRGLSASYKPSPGNNQQTFYKPSNVRYQGDDIEVNRRRNKKLFYSYKEKHPRKQFHIPEDTWRDIEYADYDVLEGYLDAVATGDKQDTQQEYEVLHANTEFNKLEYQRSLK